MPASGRDMPRLPELTSVAALPTTVADTCGSGEQLARNCSAVAGRAVSSAIAPVAGPQPAVDIDNLDRAGTVDALEHVLPEHLHRLVLLGRVQERGLAHRDALDLGYAVGDELMLGRAGVGGGRPCRWRPCG